MILIKKVTNVIVSTSPYVDESEKITIRCFEKEYPVDEEVSGYYYSGTPLHQVGDICLNKETQRFWMISSNRFKKEVEDSLFYSPAWMKIEAVKETQRTVDVPSFAMLSTNIGQVYTIGNHELLYFHDRR